MLLTRLGCGTSAVLRAWLIVESCVWSVGRLLRTLLPAILMCMRYGGALARTPVVSCLRCFSSPNVTRQLCTELYMARNIFVHGTAQTACMRVQMEVSSTCSARVLFVTSCLIAHAQLRQCCSHMQRRPTA